MGNAASRVWYHICPHKRKGLHTCQCYLQTLYTRYLWKGNRNSAPPYSKNIHHTTGRHNWSHPAYRLSTTTAIPQHELHLLSRPFKNKINSVKQSICELHLGANSSFYLNSKGILICTLVINNLNVSTIVVLLTLTNTLLYKFHDCRGHQELCQNTKHTEEKILVERHAKTC